MANIIVRFVSAINEYFEDDVGVHEIVKKALTE
jgi:hypothetical protein